MDCTIVSLLPYEIYEEKPTVTPFMYRVPAAKDKTTPGILHVEDGVSRLYQGDGRTFPVKCPAEEIAQALVHDYWTSLLEADEEARPALFWLYDKLSAANVIKDHATELAEAKKRQNKWFFKLVQKADDDWSVSKQHRMISDLQRHAAIALGLVNKEWAIAGEVLEFIKCPYCSTMVEGTAAICHNCKQIVNKVRAVELGMVPAELPTPTPTSKVS